MLPVPKQQLASSTHRWKNDIHDQKNKNEMVHNVSTIDDLESVLSLSQYNLTTSKRSNSKSYRGIKMFQKAAWAVYNYVKMTRMFYVDGMVVDKEKNSPFSNQKAKEKVSTTSFSFDINDYLSGKYAYTSVRAVRGMLKKNPTERTDMELNILSLFMEKIKIFEKYNSTIRFEIAKIVQYETFGPSRVLVKQGHPAKKFYYLLSGSVQIHRDSDGTDDDQGPRISFLKEGDYFGEESLFSTNAVRKGTAVTRELCELAIVEGHAFENILKVVYTKNIQERVDYLTQMPLLNGISEETIRKLAAVCLTRDFPLGSMVVSSDADGDDLFFIVSGIANVQYRIQVAQKTINGKVQVTRELNSLAPQLKNGEQSVSKTLHICKLNKCDSFGEDQIFSSSRRIALTHLVQKGTREKYMWTVIACSRLSCLTIPKVEFLRMLSDSEFDCICRNYKPYPPTHDLIQSYFIREKWEKYKKDYVQQILDNKKARIGMLYFKNQ